MIAYVLGVAKDKFEEVVLIEKKRPEWQAGKYNFIGGKIKTNELDLKAMSREFHEETGVLIEEGRWKKFGYFMGANFIVHLFETEITHEEITSVNTQTDEDVFVLQWDELNVLHEDGYLISNMMIIKAFLDSTDYKFSDAFLRLTY